MPQQDWFTANGIKANVESATTAPAPNPNIRPVSTLEPTTFWGGFFGGILRDKALMTTAGVAGALAMAPATGGGSTFAIPAMLGAAGGAAGAGAANLAGLATGQEEGPLLSNVGMGAAEGALAGGAGPVLNVAGKAAGYVGGKMGRVGRAMATGGMLYSRGPAGMATEVALNPSLGPAWAQAAGKAATVPTVKRTVAEVIRDLRTAAVKAKTGVTADDVQMVASHIQHGMNQTTAFRIIGENDPEKIAALKQLYIQGKLAAARAARP